METFWRRFLSMLLVLVVLLGTNGCGTATSTGSAPNSVAVVEPTAAPAAAAPASTALPAPTQPPTVTEAPTALPDQLISSNPQLVATPAPAAQPAGPGVVGGAPPAAPPSGAASPQEPAMPIQPTAWLTYTNQTYNFAIAYPDTYVLLDQADAQDQAQAQAKRVFQVRFQDQRIAAGATASMEPPQFQIEVFDNTATLSLGRWLEDHRMNGERADVTLGGQAALRVTLMTLMAPNQFYYVARGPYVYRLTPLGPFSERMLASFSFS